jgi:CcmD family protein
MTTPLVRRFALATAALVLAGGLLAAAAAAQPQTPPAAQSEFVPIDELEPQEQLPAAPLVIAAYALAWLAIFLYLWSIWRRLQKVDRELTEVSRRVTDRVRS